MSVLKIKQNGEWIPVSVGAQGPRGPAGEGTGDMLAAIYDPQGKARDVFKYVDDEIAGISKPDVSAEIGAHNTDEAAHADIRKAAKTAQDAANSKASMVEVNAAISAAIGAAIGGSY